MTNTNATTSNSFFRNALARNAARRVVAKQNRQIAHAINMAPTRSSRDEIRFLSAGR